MPEETATSDDWVVACRIDDVPDDGGACVLVAGEQIAIFHFTRRQSWYATQNRCPHWNEMVIWRGLVGELDGEPKVVCPMHKRSYSLESGKSLGEGSDCLTTYEVRVEDGVVWLNTAARETRQGEAHA